MAQHVLTFADLKNEVEHAISGAPDSRTPTARLVNGALEYLCQQHAWSWRTVLTTLAVTAGQGSIALPDDFGELVDVQGFQLRTTGLKKAHPRLVMAARVNNGVTPASTYSFLFYVGQSAQADPSIVPPRTLELGPVPAATQADAFYLTYRRLIPKLVGDTDVPPLPYGFFELFRLCCRGWAAVHTLGAPNADWQTFQELLPHYISADGLSDGPNLGALSRQIDDFPFGSTEWTLGPGTPILMPGD
jgi:hypothetical protein